MHNFGIWRGGLCGQGTVLAPTQRYEVEHAQERARVAAEWEVLENRRKQLNWEIQNGPRIQVLPEVPYQQQQDYGWYNRSRNYPMETSRWGGTVVAPTIVDPAYFK